MTESGATHVRGNEPDPVAEYATVTVERSADFVATVTLNRPEVLNAFDITMQDEFVRVWAQLRADDSVRTIVLRAAGDRAFSTGLDVAERTGERENPWIDEARPWDDADDPGPKLGPKQNGLWKPVVAAVNGMCAGGAFYWVAECDIVICDTGATFFDPHVTYGLVAALEPILLTYRMHLSDVLRMSLLGLQERMGAERAVASGLVTEIVPADELHARAHEIAAAIAQQPPAAVQGTVKAIWQSLDRGRRAALDTGLMYTQVGNAIGTRGLDRARSKPAKWRLR
jgi:enoyl-CoA hydratase/carnithine racemase